MNSTLNWTGGMSFSATNRSHTSSFDVVAEQGGSDSAPTPKEVLLNAMSACSAMDVVSILNKMRLPLAGFKIEAEADKTKTIPSYFSEARLHYQANGEIPVDKLIQAVTLSMTKYCGVSYMVSKTTVIRYKISLNGTSVHEGVADFKVEDKT